MNKLQLKEIIATLDAIGVPDTAEVKVEMAIDNSRIPLKNEFKVEKQDAEFAVDASGHYAASVTQADAVVFKQG